MGYIKFRLNSHKTDNAGNMTRAAISRIESDMAGTGTFELNLIMHSLSAPGGKIALVSEFILGSGMLNNDNDILG